MIGLLVYDRRFLGFELNCNTRVGVKTSYKASYSLRKTWGWQCHGAA